MLPQPSRLCCFQWQHCSHIAFNLSPQVLHVSPLSLIKHTSGAHRAELHRFGCLCYDVCRKDRREHVQRILWSIFKCS
ncbi:hypothetical protein CPB83DRAFT_862654 [Crepidotus variabilis]|uniref:Uncharacterized protein n=1 Tax=Crepidotus variabilis TaxID=179855 RepID=A0A9P6JK12_9AGAR|nr:hypothetical protein CPB83DRAFT_862654 [Crepidotus variabilis]